MNLVIIESVTVDAVSIPRGWMDYAEALIRRIELRYPGHRKFFYLVVPRKLP